MPSLAHTTIELHSKWTFTSSTSAPVPTSRTTPSPGAMTKPTALPLDVIINIIFGLVMALLGLVTIYQAARFAAIHVRRRCTLFLSRPPCTFLKLLTQAGGPPASVDNHHNEQDLEIPGVSNVDVEPFADPDTASVRPMRQEDIGEAVDSMGTRTDTLVQEARTRVLSRTPLLQHIEPTSSRPSTSPSLALFVHWSLILRRTLGSRCIRSWGTWKTEGGLR
jgi:hypothetical protein